MTHPLGEVDQDSTIVSIWTTPHSNDFRFNGTIQSYQRSAHRRYSQGLLECCDRTRARWLPSISLDQRHSEWQSAVGRYMIHESILWSQLQAFPPKWYNSPSFEFLHGKRSRISGRSLAFSLCGWLSIFETWWCLRIWLLLQTIETRFREAGFKIR